VEFKIPYPVYDQFQYVGEPVLVSVKVTTSGVMPVTADGVNDATIGVNAVM
jgi:hypothetical protein